LKDVEQLIYDNEQLQGKLHAQEEHFRLQHQTLMSELSAIMKKNEENEMELRNYRESIERVETNGEQKSFKNGTKGLEKSIKKNVV
jgi:hypothetical protein